jgi:hypothetical protein
MVLSWPRHLRYRCPPDCERCCICEGGLYSCVTCGGAEGSLPTDCPGRRMTSEEQDEVYAERLNYVRGAGWVEQGDRQWRSNTSRG